jgi:hypothetical protein
MLHVAHVAKVIALLLVTVSTIACTQTEGTVRGVITTVEGDLDDVVAFTALVDGAELRFVPVQDGDYDFPLPHLREHQLTGEPVLVDWELVGTVRYALSVADG